MINMNKLELYSEQEIEKILRKANKMYRTGHPMLSDEHFDLIVEELERRNPNNPFLQEVGYIVVDDRTEALPYTMGSLNKVKTYEQLIKRCNSYNIPLDTKVIITPKYDGISLLSNENGKAWTRGNGYEGNRSDTHIKLLNTPPLGIDLFTIGEVIMSKDKFNRFVDTYANPRSLVAGAMNNKLPYKVKKELLNMDYIRYGSPNSTQNKSTIIDTLNRLQPIKVPYTVISIDKINDTLLEQLYNDWNSQNYNLDGLVIDVDDYLLRLKLNRDTKNNPKYAFAYKGNFEETANVPIKNIEYQISKRGKATPVFEFEPFKLSGVMISRATGHNAKFLKDNDIGIGSVVTIKRSGEVIPYVVNVISSTGFVEPTHLGTIKWSETGTDLFVIGDNDEKNIQQILSFYKTLEFDDVGYGFVKTLYHNGIDTVDKTLNVLSQVLLTMDGIGESKASTFLSQINNLKNNGVNKVKLMAATGFFPLLGERKLKLLEHFDTKPTLEEVIKIKGFSDKSADIYLANYDKFIKFAYRNSLELLTEDNVVGSLTGQQFIFTGFRDKQLESNIISNGGEIVKTVKKGVIVIVKDVNSTSSKVKKAKELNCKIINRNDFKI